MVEGRIDGSCRCGEECSDGVVGVVGEVVAWIRIKGVGSCGLRICGLFCCHVDDLVTGDASVSRDPSEVYSQSGGGGLIQGLQEFDQDGLSSGVTWILQRFQGTLLVGENGEVVDELGLAMIISKARRIPCSSAAYTVLWASVPMYCVFFWTTGLDINLGFGRIAAAAPTCPLIPLPSVYVHTVSVLV